MLPCLYSRLTVTFSTSAIIFNTQRSIRLISQDASSRIPLPLLLYYPRISEGLELLHDKGLLQVCQRQSFARESLTDGLDQMAGHSRHHHRHPCVCSYPILLHQMLLSSRQRRSQTRQHDIHVQSSPLPRLPTSKQPPQRSPTIRGTSTLCTIRCAQ